MPVSCGPVKRLRLGLLGCGHVGAALVTLLEEQRPHIAARTGLDLEITRIAVRSMATDRGLNINPAVFTTDAQAVVTDSAVDLVVEVIGGIDPARGLVMTALEHGKPVVTANKELLANYGAELLRSAADLGLDLMFEAAVAGAIPLLRPLRESLVGEPITRVMGIVNGTTNYILTQMAERDASYAEALREAQDLGYAERDPTADVEGHDAAAKAAIIATVAFGAAVVAADVYHEGISNVTKHDIGVAQRLGYVIKAVAVVEKVGQVKQVGKTQEVEKVGQVNQVKQVGQIQEVEKVRQVKRIEEVEQVGRVKQIQSASDMAMPELSESDTTKPELAVRVHPAMVPVQHPLASVRDSFNAVFVEGGAVGELMFYGRGAGGRPTAGAVLGDIVDAAANLTAGCQSGARHLVGANIRSIDDLRSAYYIGLEVADQPGVLAAVAEVFAHHRVSIRLVEQHGLREDARLVFITHVSREQDVQATLRDLRGLDAVHKLGTVIRVVGDEPDP